MPPLNNFKPINNRKGETVFLHYAPGSPNSRHKFCLHLCRGSPPLRFGCQVIILRGMHPILGYFSTSLIKYSPLTNNYMWFPLKEILSERVIKTLTFICQQKDKSPYLRYLYANHKDYSYVNIRWGTLMMIYLSIRRLRPNSPLRINPLL